MERRIDIAVSGCTKLMVLLIAARRTPAYRRSRLIIVAPMDYSAANDANEENDEESDKQGTE